MTPRLARLSSDWQLQGQADDTKHKRSVFDFCSKHARKTGWAEFVPAMRNKVVRFKVIDEDECEHQLNTVLEG